MMYRLFLLFILISGCESDKNSNPEELELAPVFEINKIATLDASITESSGIMAVDGSLYTHSDISGEAPLIKINLDGSIKNTHTFKNIPIRDWEDIAADDNFIYIGDIGNNLADKTDLKVYKIAKSQMDDSNPELEVMTFSFEDQVKFNETDYNQTSHDMEALAVIDNTIYVFTKDWIHLNTNIYSFENTTGTRALSPLATLNIGGLVTGATTNPAGEIILCGYSPTLSPFIAKVVMDNGVPKLDRKINITGMLGTGSQIEGITYFGIVNSVHTYYLTSEQFTRTIAGREITLPANLYELKWNE